MAWYEVHCLASATEANREDRLVRIAALGDAAVPALIHCLHRQDAQACANAQAALAMLAGPAEKRQAEITAKLAKRFPALHMAGQLSILDLATDWLRKSPAQSRGLLPAVVRLLPPAGRACDPEVRARALSLVAVVLNHECTDDERYACRELVRTALQDPESANRVDAVRMASSPSLNLVHQIAPLVNDADARVRQTAMAVVGCTPEAIATDDLLRSLHDSDADVRRLCEAALRGRGLRNEDVTLGRLITDARASVRLQVLERLARPDLESGTWLRRLSQDPAPAVRAAAVRVAVEARLDLGDQLEKMALNDASSTVRQLAQHYLKSQKNR